MPEKITMKVRLSEVLKDLLKDRGMSLRALSRETGVSASTLSGLLSGKQSQRPDQLIKIARCLRVSVDFLLTGEDPNDMDELELDKIPVNEIFSGWVKIRIEKPAFRKKTKPNKES